MAEMVRCSASTTRAPIGSRTSARRSARSTGLLCQRWVPPTVSAEAAEADAAATTSSAAGADDATAAVSVTAGSTDVVRRSFAVEGQEARAKRRCRYLGTRCCL